VPAPAVESRAWSPIQLALAVAWACLAATLLAIAALLWGVVTLSERRAAFVAAVTHELRTPLTTFRLYSEMLAGGMAPPEKRQQYLETLHAEAERLTHLVENVLSYARLERGRRAPRVRIGLGELLAQWTPCLADRAAQADLELVSEANRDTQSATLATDPQAVGQILFNLVDNASKYASRAQQRRIELSCQVEAKTARIRVRDYGPGLSATQRRRLFEPFSKTVEEAAVTAPGVGLGLALCRRLARDLGGRLEYEPTHRDGASFVLELPVVAKAPSETP
jgi:signal transduction histidine kinase